MGFTIYQHSTEHTLDGEGLREERGDYGSAMEAVRGWLDTYRAAGYRVRGLGPNQWLAERGDESVNIDLT